MDFKEIIEACVKETLDTYGHPFDIEYLTVYTEQSDRIWYISFNKKVIPIRSFKKVLAQKFEKRNLKVDIHLVRTLKVRDSLIIKIGGGNWKRKKIKNM